MMTRGDTLSTLKELAWLIYCEDTAGSLDVRDNWEELPSDVQHIYLKKALNKNNKVPNNDNRIDSK